jgi:hypothetical protein
LFPAFAHHKRLILVDSPPFEKQNELVSPVLETGGGRGFWYRKAMFNAPGSRVRV